jgi:hypothetical protein
MRRGNMNRCSECFFRENPGTDSRDYAGYCSKNKSVYESDDVWTKDCASFSPCKTEYRLGERFKYAGVELEVCGEQSDSVEVWCEECYFKNKDCPEDTLCSGGTRDDKQVVIFKEVKDDKMKKPVFENEEEVREIFDNITKVSGWRHGFIVRRAVLNAKRLGYIKQSKLEEAKEAYYNDTTIPPKAYDYIKELEKELDK